MTKCTIRFKKWITKKGKYIRSIPVFKMNSYTFFLLRKNIKLPNWITELPNWITKKGKYVSCIMVTI
jgi:hypothetical protein